MFWSSEQNYMLWSGYLLGKSDLDPISVSCRLRCLVKQLDKGEVNVVDLRKNIEYAASVLEAVYIDETRWESDVFLSSE